MVYYTYIYHENQPIVGKYTIHGSYGIGFVSFMVQFSQHKNKKNKHGLLQYSSKRNAESNPKFRGVPVPFVFGGRCTPPQFPFGLHSSVTSPNHDLRVKTIPTTHPEPPGSFASFFPKVQPWWSSQMICCKLWQPNLSDFGSNFGDLAVVETIKSPGN